MNPSTIGEWAALTTAFCWTITAISFEKAGKHVGSLPVNLIRLVLAMILFTGYMLIRKGTLIPMDATPYIWFWLIVSGLIGFVIGDLLLFRAFVEIGSRVSMLVMASVPVLTALMGWFWMHERLSKWDITGMMITISGIIMVVLNHNSEKKKFQFSHPIRGILLAFGGALGQSIGLILSKHGMGDFDPFAATQIRVIAGIAGFSVLFFPLRRWGHVGRAFRSPKGMLPTTIGAVFGPFLGVSFSLLAIQHTLTGIASTIMAIVPILLIPAAVIFLHERVTLREITGAFIAVGGVALLFLV